MSLGSMSMIAAAVVALIALSQIALLLWVARIARVVSEVVAREEGDLGANETAVSTDRLAA
ncbi:MAG: hypothetical protein U0610_15935 [bacterium]